MPEPKTSKGVVGNAVAIPNLLLVSSKNRFASNGTNKWSAGNVQSDHRFRIFSEANSAELITILQTGEFGIGIANPTTKFHIDGAASALIANLDANVSIAKSISFRSDNSARINLEVSGTESGSNAGADFFLRTFTDAGSLLETPFTIVRSTGVTTIKSLTLTNALSVANGGTGSTTQNFVDLTSIQTAAGAKTFSAITTISNATASTSTTTGGLVVTGGFGIGGALFGTSATFTSSSFPLDIYGTTNNYGLRINNVQASTLFLYSSNANAANRNWGLFTNSEVYGDFDIRQSNAINGDLTNGANSTSRLYIKNNGNVGIGTSSPTHNLEIANPSGSVYQKLNADFGIAYIGMETFDDTMRFVTAQATPIVFYTDNNERMRITSGGVVQIANLAGSGSRTVTADASGNLSASSDSSLKQEDTLHKIEGLVEILQLQPRAYKWKSDIEIRGEEATTEIGFFANEVNAIIPSAAPKGYDDLFGFYDRAVIAALVKGMQEQDAKIEELKALIAAK